MKITLNKINDIISQNFEFDFMDEDTNQIRLCFGDQAILIKFGTKADKGSTGLHVHNIKTDHDLEQILVNAVDRALSNDFNAIYVHAGTRSYKGVS